MAEKELAIDLQFRGFLKRVIDLSFAEKLEVMAQRIESQPGDNQVFVDLFNELASIFAGESAIGFYSRKEEIGFSRYKENKLGLTNENAVGGSYWERVESVTKYQRISPGLYFNRNSMIYGSRDEGDPLSYQAFLKNPERMKKLLQRRIGKGYARKNKFKSNSKLNVYDFEVLVQDEEDNQVYKLIGRKLILNETKESRLIIRMIVKPIRGFEARYYLQMSNEEQTQGFTVTLENKIEDYEEIIVLPRIVYKIKHKHRYEPSELRTLLSTNLSNVRSLVPSNRYYSGYLKDGKMKIVFSKHRSDPTKLILKTAYYEDITSEEMLEDLEYSPNLD